MKKIIISIFLAFFALSMTACSNGKEAQVKSHKKAAKHSSIPRSSKFSRVKEGMGVNQVIALIGNPTDRSAYMTGKAFIPFYFGTDAARSVFYYKRQGELQFNTRGLLVKIVYDPSEDGYRG